MRMLDTTLWRLPFDLMLCSSTPLYLAVLDSYGVLEADRTAFPNIDGGAHTVLHHNFRLPGTKDVCIIAVRPGAQDGVIRLHLVHEAVHVWQYHCEAIGETQSGWESAAYGIQNIFTRLLEAYNAQQRTKL